MKNIKSFLGDILEKLDRADALTELNPKVKGRYVYLTCPSCGQNTAYISQQGFYIYCNRKNHCGYTNGLLEYICQRDNINEDQAIKILAELTNTELPALSTEEYNKYTQQRQRERLYKDILSIAKCGIWLSTGQFVKTYLNDRGYSDTEIISMNFGYLPIISQLRLQLIKQGHLVSQIEEVLSSFSQNHPLLIPIYNNYGTLDGFISRTIDNSITPKYLYTKQLQRGSYFLNFNECKQENILIIVEGIIDALLLTQKGIPGVVACGGDSPTENQIINALKYGKLKDVILCLDNDQAGIRGTEKAIKLFKKHNINVYIANTYPHKDPDEFIKYQGIEEFKNKLYQAQYWVNWQSENIINTHDISNDIGRNNALHELLYLSNSLTDPISNEYIINFIIDKLNFSKATISDSLRNISDKQKLSAQSQIYKSMLEHATSLLKSKKIDELNNCISDGILKAKAITTSQIITQYSIEEAIKDISLRQSGLNSGYPNLDKYLTIPNGAITLIAGRPSHGKTTFLLNLLLNMIEDNPDKQFYFFSYEESKTALFVKLINIMAQVIVNAGLEYKNSQQLEYYIKNGSNKIPQINSALEKYKEYVKSNRIWIIDNALSVDMLSSIIGHLSKENQIGGCFIDYAQRIKYSGKYESERVKIARVSEILRETATKLDIPFLVGAQLNRDNAKQKPQLDNLKEAGNLEEDANIVLGLYNWKTAIDKEKADETLSNGEIKKNKLRNCYGMDINIDSRNIDFEVHILKNRNGSINETALLSLDAPVLKINNRDDKLLHSVF